MKRIILLFIFLSSILFGDELDDMKKKVNDIEKGIEESSQRITTIGQDRDRIREQIKNIETDLKNIEIEKKELLNRINSLSKKIDYGNINLKFSSKELEIRNSEYNAKLVAWDKIERNSRDNEYTKGRKKDFKELLYSDLEALEHIRVVQKDIDLVKNDIEIDRREQTKLKNRLAEKERQEAGKIREKDNLIAQLNKQEVYHKKKITSLEQEKNRVEKEIERIIIERSRQVKDVSLATAKSKIGNMKKPLDGNYAVSFGQKKQGNVVSSGIEIASKLGSRVKSSAAGKVIYSGKFQGLGKVVMVDYGYNMIGIYGNLITSYVEVGNIVKKEQDIGILGLSTDGKSNLYYELRFNLKAINPITMF